MLKSGFIKIIFILFSLLAAACSNRFDSLSTIAEIKSDLNSCLNSQELPDDCKLIEEALRKAKLSALGNGHSDESISSAELIGSESVPNVERNSPINKIRAAFSSTLIPGEPDDLIFRLFSSRYSCGELKELVGEKDLYIWSSRGINNNKLIFVVVPFIEIKLRTIFAKSGVDTLDTSPCLSINDIDDSFAILTKSQVSTINTAAPKVKGLTASVKIIPSMEEASDYFHAELARHCIHVVPSIKGAKINIKYGEQLIENQSLVKPGIYSVEVSKPGYLPFSSSVEVKEPTRINALLDNALSINSCQSSSVKIIDARNAVREDDCSWSVFSQEDLSASNEYSVIVKNNNVDSLYAVEYLEEKYDSSGVKRKSELRFSVINGGDSKFSDGEFLAGLNNSKSINILESAGVLIPPGQAGRIDRILPLGGMSIGFNSEYIKTKVLRYFFVKNGATIPARRTIESLFVLNELSESPKCTVD